MKNVLIVTRTFFVCRVIAVNKCGVVAELMIPTSNILALQPEARTQRDPASNHLMDPHHFQDGSGFRSESTKLDSHTLAT